MSTETQGPAADLAAGTDLEREIRYNPSLLRQDFFQNLNDFSTWIHTETVRDAVGQKLLQQLRGTENRVRARLEGDFTLAVIGDFKRGKSTLVNALLGTKIATTNVTPETVTINEIQHGPELTVEACLADGGRLSLNPDELPADRLTPISERLGEKLSHLSVLAPVEFLRGLRLVDTPGLGDIMDRFNAQVQSYLANADSVIYVISAVSPLSESEQVFLQLSVAPQEFPKLIFVVNMMDIAATDEDAERLLASIREKIDRVFPSAQVFGVSALDEFARLQSLPRPNPERAAGLEAGFQALRDTLQASILVNRDYIQLDRAGAQMEAMLQEFDGRIQMLRGALQEDQNSLVNAIDQCEDQSSELHQKIDQHKAHVRHAIQEMGREACGWMGGFIDRLEREAFASLGEHSHADVQQHFPFFLADTLRNAINLCGVAHQQAISEAVEKAREEILADFRGLTPGGKTEVKLGEAVSRATFGQGAWTAADTLHLVLGHALGPVFELIMHTFKERQQKGAETAAYQQRLQASLPELRQSVDREVRALYSELANQIEEQITSSYRQEMEASVAAMRQAQELNARGAERVGAANQVFEEVLTHVAAAREFLRTQEQKLWANTDATLDEVRMG